MDDRTHDDWRGRPQKPSSESPPLSDLSREQEEAFALGIAPSMKELMTYVKARLPDGTHFAILIEVQGKGVARLLVASTDRQRMGLRAAEWALSLKKDGAHE